mmetsp:Transcript_39735/g.124824  ORF Transcript_39735/g.124824 Transcript_39735/m.124824 type:complete len:153 (+) Transcript_39735:1026-1484(+)
MSTCAATSSCIAKMYSDGSISLGCVSSDQCYQARGQKEDSMGVYNYACCSSDLCNAASSKIDLYGIYSQVSTECPGSYYVSKYQIGNTSGVNVSIKQGGDSFYQHQISSWTFGVPPPTLRNYLTAQDSSSPGCLYVGGIIQKGFCTTSSGRL